MSATCEHTRAHMLDLLEHAGPDGHHRAALSHIHTCEGCAAELEALREAIGLLDGARSVAPSTNIRSRLLAYAGEADAIGRRPGKTVPAARSQWGAVAAVAAAVVLGVWVTNPRGHPDEPSTLPSPAAPSEAIALAVGRSFPDFAAIDVSSGEPVSLSDLEGDVVLLNIWATWCGPCETEMLSMERLYREFASKGLSVVAVSVDQESTSKVRQWVEERGLSFTVLHDSEGRFERSFRAVGVPESFVINREGVLVAREIGPRLWDSPATSALIRGLIEGGE